MIRSKIMPPGVTSLIMRPGVLGFQAIARSNSPPNQISSNPFSQQSAQMNQQNGENNFDQQPAQNGIKEGENIFGTCSNRTLGENQSFV